MTGTLILLRHGQSQWNLENRFTGWVDVDITPQGRLEAEAAGKLLLEQGIQIDRAFVSVLKRAIRTLWITLDEMDQMWVPVEHSWKLNERHYGALQGLNKPETAAKYGEDQVLIWRRSFDTPPPMMAENDDGHPGKDRRYKNIPIEKLPVGESLSMTLDRVLPYWRAQIEPHLAAGETILVAAHGNSIRAIVKHLDGMSEEEITGLNIPTAVPLVYRFGEALTVLDKRYLGDTAAIEAAALAVANQGKANNE
ncbi:2,3-diphosphoglycerate-dependent phosphoglycerate mutase [Limibacillus sp. MBR-115]|uniref:2,3-diphosphoglycerate-dependent phosphoglycerate mutase n=1 Tax=Limibacillus sp. MBR-115 TaxID=3156465 RepID=UPI00339B5AE8